MTHPRRFRRHLLSAAAVLALTPSAFASDYYFNSGTYTAPNPIGSGDTLHIGSGGQKYINSAIGNNGTVRAGDDLYFQNGNVIANAGLFDWTGDFGFYDGGYNGGFNNTGTLRKSGGTGTSYVSISGFVSTGTINAQSGTINFSSGNATFNTGTQFTGSGSTVVSNGAYFNGAFTSQNLTLTGGSFTGNGAQMNGTTNLQGGYIAGTWEVASGQTLQLVGGGQKFVNGSLVNSGSVVATDDLYFQNGNVLTNNAVFASKGDVGLYDGGYNGSLVNNGSFAKTAGTGTSVVSITGFVNNGVVDAQTGTINFGNGNTTFNAGSQFIGAGSTIVTGGAYFNGAFTSQNLTLVGGSFAGNAAQFRGTTDWQGGYLTGTWEVASGQDVRLVTGGQKFVDGSVTNNGTVTATDDLYFQNGNVLTNNAVFVSKGDVGLYDGGYNGSFVNNGVLTKSAGVGASNVSITGFVNNGVVDVQTGTFNFNGGATFNNGSQFTGAGRSVVTANASFNGGHTAAGNLQLASGSFYGTAAKVNGETLWTGGSLTGTWEVGSGGTLALAGGGQKFVNGSVTNSGSMVATDDLYFQNGNVLTNNGVYALKGDVGVYDGGYNGSLLNNGSFAKTAGSGTSYVSITGFVNSGVVDAQTGTINFNGGATFSAGTQFKGSGSNLVTYNATFNGAFTSQNLTLASGSFNGGNGSSGASATLAGGSVNWTGGSVTGNWNVGADATVQIATGGQKFVNGSLTNAGRMVATDDLYFQNGNTLTNNGVYELRGNVNLADGGYNGHFVNNGTLLKSEGSGIGSVAGIGFVNNGTVDVRSGTVALPSSFGNPGTVTGSGALSTDLFTNSGHVAPGAGVGTLTLNGNFAQTTAGFMDIQLASSLSFDEFLVNGTASLHGTLALSCIASCALHTGDIFTIFDSSGDLTGAFDAVTTSGFLDGFAYSVVYDYADDRVSLQVLDAGANTPPPIAAVPEPGSWALMFAGLGVVGALARRRRARGA